MEKSLDNLMDEYRKKEPEITFEWHDPHTDAKGWIVINSLRNGAAGGGTRMRKGLTKDEVTALAKVMEVKFTVSGPAIGGAKSGIDFDPADPRRHEVLQRWYKAAFPILKNYYGTGGDLNVDELKDVVPITEELGLWHPQEGIVRGHFGEAKGEQVKILGQLRYGCTKLVEDHAYSPSSQYKYAVADLITGFGVARSVKHFYHIFRNQNLEGKRVIIQGWGNVASAAGFYLADMGARIVGILDRTHGVLAPEGLNKEEVRELFTRKAGNTLSTDKMLPFEEVNARIWDLPCDVFIPAAASRLVSPEQVDRLIQAGMEVMACGANVPFTDDGIFFGPTARTTDERIALIPDFIANCGMARVFAYLMQADKPLTDEAMFEDVSEVIRTALQEVHRKNPQPHHISSTALETALRKLS